MPNNLTPGCKYEYNSGNGDVRLFSCVLHRALLCRRADVKPACDWSSDGSHVIKWVHHCAEKLGHGSQSRGWRSVSRTPPRTLS